MLYMVIEHFRRGPGPVYERVDAQGRLLPEGLNYIESWVSEDMERCFQLMSCDDRALLDAWMDRWSDLVAFDVIPVIASADARGQVSSDGRS